VLRYANGVHVLFHVGGLVFSECYMLGGIGLGGVQQLALGMVVSVVRARRCGAGSAVGGAGRQELQGERI
jgi:hypothetical protein